MSFLVSLWCNCFLWCLVVWFPLCGVFLVVSMFFFVSLWYNGFPWCMSIGLPLCGLLCCDFSVFLCVFVL